MRCHNYAHSDEEITRIRERAQSQRGYVDGSWIQADAGHDGFGGRLTLCSWRWATPQPPDLVRGSDHPTSTDNETCDQVRGYTK